MSLFRRNKPAAEPPAQGATRIQTAAPARQSAVQRRLLRTTVVVVSVFAGLIYWLESRRSEPVTATVAPQVAPLPAAAPAAVAATAGKPADSKVHGKTADSKAVAAQGAQKGDPRAAAPAAAPAAGNESAEDRFNFYKMLAGQTDTQPPPAAVLEPGKAATPAREPARPPVVPRPPAASVVIPPAQIPPARASQPPLAVQPAAAAAQPPARAAQPVAVAPAPAAAVPPAAQPAAAAQPPAATRPATPAPAAVPGAARYILQAGSYSSAEQAASVRDKLAQLGLTASVQTGQVGDKTWYRVQTGPFNEGDALNAASQKLQGAGFSPLSLRQPQ